MREADVKHAAYAGTTAMSGGSGKQSEIGQLSCFPGLLSTSSGSDTKIGKAGFHGPEDLALVKCR
jgi:hypothetical protein